MATLVSPGVSVTVTDESFFIPAASPTVPLFFIATQDEKKQPDGVTDAAGTFESGVVRTVTSQRQVLELYGNPVFLEDSAGNQFHGDARNEYGLFALWQFMAQGTRAYVTRANVNLDDDIDNIRALWDKKITEASFNLENLTSQLISESNLLATPPKFPGDPWVNAFWQFDFGTGVLEGDSVIVGSPNLADCPAGSPCAFITVQVNNGTIVETVTAELTAAFLTGTGTGTGSPPPLTFKDVLDEIETQLNAQLDPTNQITAYVGKTNGDASGPGVLGSPTIKSAATQGTGSTTDKGPGTMVTLITDAVFLVTPGYVGSGAMTAGVAGYKETITQSEYESLVNQVMTDTVYPLYSFQNVESDFEDDQTLSPFPVFPNGFDQPSTSNFYGIEGYANCGPGGDPDLGSCPNGTGSNTEFPNEWTATDASDDLVFAADQYKYTTEFFDKTSLGANDNARRVAITTALQAEINSNTDIRSENFEYNLLACPGYHEVVDELVSLATGIDVRSEAFVVADTPVNLDPAETVSWAQTTQRVTSAHVAYYYPWQEASNLDGTNVVISPAGTALRTYAFSDEVSELWFAPAGTRRGVVAGVSDLGYVTGTLGGPTELVQTYLNQGQRDDLYRYFVNINPIVFFPGRGILVWGQKTVAPDASALDRVNVQRLVTFLRRQLRKNTLSFVFEPNDQLTRDNLKAVVDAFLSDIVIRRGLFDYATISDETNNTPDRIDRNELWIDVAIKPVKAAEFIYIPIRIVSTDAEI